MQTHCPHVAPALDTISTSQRQLTPWSQLNLGIPQVPAAAVTARQISPDAASSSGPSIMAATAALQPMCSTRRRPPLLSHPLAATAAMAAITAAPSSLSLFATASKPIRYVDAIERCAALHDVVSLWKASERDLRVHHWALLSLRAAKLRKEHKFKGMTLQRAQVRGMEGHVARTVFLHIAVHSIVCGSASTMCMGTNCRLRAPVCTAGTWVVRMFVAVLMDSMLALQPSLHRRWCCSSRHLL